MKTRILSFLLAVLMVITAVPAMTLFTFAEEAETPKATAEDYNALYAQNDKMIIGADFFTSASDDSKKLTANDLKAYFYKGAPGGSINPNYNNVYAGNRSLSLRLLDGVGGNIPWDTSNEKHDLNRNLTYQYVFSLDSTSSSTLSQLLSSTMARIAINYNANTGKVYPSSASTDMKNEAGDRSMPSKAFAESAFSNLSSLGESMTVTHQTVLTTNGNGSVEDFVGGSVAGKIYVNDGYTEYTETLTRNDSHYRINGSYASTGTGSNTSGTANVSYYAIRIYITTLTELEILQNNLVDIAKFYELDIDTVKNIFALEEDVQTDILKSLYSLKLSSKTTKEEAEAKFDELVEEGLKAYYYKNKYVKDGLVAHFLAKNFIETYGSVKKGAVTADSMGNSITWLENATTAPDGKSVYGSLSYASILDDPEKDGTQPYLNHTVDTVITATAAESNVYSAGFDKFNIVANGTNTSLRHDYSTWRFNAYEGGNTPGIGMYGATGLKLYKAKDTLIPLGETFNLTVKTQITEDRAYYSEANTNNRYNGADLNSLSNFGKVYYGPFNGKYYINYAEYAAAAGTSALSETEAAIIVGDAANGISDYMFDGYYASDLLTNGYSSQSKKFTFAYAKDKNIYRNDVGDNYGTQVIVGGTTASVFRVSVYNKILTSEEMTQNHTADMYLFYDLPAKEYAALSEDDKAFVDSKVAEWNFDTFKGDNEQEITELAEAEFAKYIAWANLDYSKFENMPERYKKYIEEKIYALDYDNYASYEKPAEEAQKTINDLVDAYNFDVSKYNRLPTQYKNAVDALVAEFDIDAILSEDDVKAAAQAAFDNAISVAINDYNALYVQNGLIAHFDAKTYLQEYTTAKDAYIDLAGAKVDFNKEDKFAYGDNYIAGSQLVYFSAIPTVDKKIVAPYTLETLVSPTTESAFVESGFSTFKSYNSSASKFGIRHNFSTWRFSVAYMDGSSKVGASLSQEMFIELGTAAAGIGKNALIPNDVFTFTHRVEDVVVSDVTAEDGKYKFFDDNDIFYHTEMLKDEWYLPWDDATGKGSLEYIQNYYYYENENYISTSKYAGNAPLTTPTEVRFDGYFTYSIITDANRISGAGMESDKYSGGVSFVYPSTVSDGVITPTNKSVIRIGNSGGDANFKIYDVRVYDRALTDEEVKKNHVVDLFKYYEVDLYDFVRVDDVLKAQAIEILSAYSINEINAEGIEEILASNANSNTYYVQDGLIAYFDAEKYIAEKGVSTSGAKDVLGNSFIWYKTPSAKDNNRAHSGSFNNSSILDDDNVDGIEPYENNTIDLMVKATEVSSDVINVGFIKFSPKSLSPLKMRDDYSSWRADTNNANMYHNSGGITFYDAENATLSGNEVFNFVIRTKITNLEATYDNIVDTYPAGVIYDGRADYKWYGESGVGFYKSYSEYSTAATKAGKTPISEAESTTQFKDIPGRTFDGYFCSEYIANNYTVFSGNFTFAYNSAASGGSSSPGVNYGTRVMLGNADAKGIDVYRVRIYNRALTDEEIAQNHFVDVAYYYGMDIVGFDKLLEMYRDEIIETFKTVTFDNTYTLDELQAMYDEIAYPDLDNTALPGTEEIISFNGYQARLVTFPGIRAHFTYDEEAIKALEEAGYSVEFGVIMAIAKEDRTSESLTVIHNGENYVATGTQMLASAVYKDGSAVGNINYEDPYYDDPSFVYAITYQNASSQTAAMYVTDCMYRGYLVAEKDGVSYVTYYDCTSSIFGESISIYELSTHLMYEDEEKIDNEIIKGVISEAGYTDDVKALYSQYAAAEKKIDELGISTLSFDELNALYNIQLKAEKDELLARKLKFYEEAGKAEDVDGCIDICAAIDAMIDAYNKEHGVDIRKSLYEITGATDTIYFDASTDKDPYSYVLGDSVTFTINLRDKTTNNVVACDAVSYSYEIDGVSAKKSSTVSAKTGTFTVTIPASEILSSSLVYEEDGEKKSDGILIRVKASAQSVTSQEAFEGGAVVDMANIKAAAEKPADYDTFWAEQLSRIEAISPTDTEVTLYTDDGVKITDVKRADGENNIGVYSTEAGKTISEDNYFHIIPLTKERIELLQKKGLHTDFKLSRLDYYDAYEVYLKSAGPTPSVGILTIPKNITSETYVKVTFAGYSAHAPGISGSTKKEDSYIHFSVSHSGYWADATDAELYDALNGKGILGAYGKAIPERDNSTYTDKADNYILYMFLRNLQAVRFLTQLPEEMPENMDDTTAAAYAVIYAALEELYEKSEGNVVINGSSMGGYQTIGTTSLAEQFGITVSAATPTIPAFCNLGGKALDGRIDDIFSIGYEENMNYFEPAFFAEYITVPVTIDRCGLGDYTCPPSGIIATYNALKSEKSITFWQNSTHSYSIDDPLYKFTVTEAAQ